MVGALGMPSLSAPLALPRRAPSLAGTHGTGIQAALLSRCLNTEVVQVARLERFEQAQFEAVGLADCTGELHEFHFRTDWFGTGVALELRDGNPAGYQVQIIGDPKDNLLLLGRWIEKMRRALSLKHLTDGEDGPQIADLLPGRME
jgi:hypothetical protein